MIAHPSRIIRLAIGDVRLDGKGECWCGDIESGAIVVEGILKATGFDESTGFII